MTIRPRTALVRGLEASSIHPRLAIIALVEPKIDSRAFMVRIPSEHLTLYTLGWVLGRVQSLVGGFPIHPRIASC